jgi:hypothetical protein
MKIEPGTIVHVEVSPAEHLSHDIKYTGHTQRRSDGRLYVEGQRTDNGLFEMIPAEWLKLS